MASNTPKKYQVVDGECLQSRHLKTCSTFEGGKKKKDVHTVHNMTAVEETTSFSSRVFLVAHKIIHGSLWMMVRRK